MSSKEPLPVRAEDEGTVRRAAQKSRRPTKLLALGLACSLAGCLSVTSPKKGDTVKGTITVTASESDAREQFQNNTVSFYVDGVLRGSDTGVPYQWAWDTSTELDGPHTLTAKAYSIPQQKTVASDPITVTVANHAPTDITPPTIIDILPHPSAALYAGNSLTISASVTDPDPTPFEYQFSIDGQVKQPWGSTATYLWNTTASMSGAHVILLEVRDAGGAASRSQSVYLYQKPPSQP